MCSVFNPGKGRLLKGFLHRCILNRIIVKAVAKICIETSVICFYFDSQLLDRISKINTSPSPSTGRIPLWLLSYTIQKTL